jgi:prepilin-type N-terminal cleavage/methylation domain-containing protein
MNFFIRKHGEGEPRPNRGRQFPAHDVNAGPGLTSAQPDTATWRRRLNARLRAEERRRQRGHTLTELMVTMAVVLFVLAGVMAAHVFGLRLFEMNKAKLGASDDARDAIGHMVTEIRAAKLIRIGDGSASFFTEVTPNTPQRGGAIQVYPTSSTNTFVRYFRDTDQKLKRLSSGTTNADVIVSFITNQVVFTAEDFSGIVLTNNENNRVIGLALQFYQLEYPTVSIGPGSLYDFYQLRTKITRRALE